MNAAPPQLTIDERVHRAQVAALSTGQVRAIEGADLATLSTTFSQNLLKETNASAVVVDTLAELDGMSEAAIAAAGMAFHAAQPPLAPTRDGHRQAPRSPA